MTSSPDKGSERDETQAFHQLAPWYKFHLVISRSEVKSGLRSLKNALLLRWVLVSVRTEKRHSHECVMCRFFNWRKSCMHAVLRIQKNIFLLAAVFLFFLPCAWSEDHHSPPQALPEVVFPAVLSGNFAVAQSLFDQGRNLAAELYGKPLPFQWVISDCQADPMKAMSEYQRGKLKGLTVAATAIRGPIGMALNPSSKRDKMPLLGVVGNKRFRIENPYAFQVWASSDVEGKFYANLLLEKGIQRASLVYMEDDWLSAVATEFAKAYRELGGTLLSEVALLPTEQDYATPTLNLRAKSPEAIVMLMGPAQAGTFVKAYRRDDRKTLLVANYMMSTKDALDIAGKEASNGILLVEISDEFPGLQEEARKRGPALAGIGVTGFVMTRYLIQAFELNPEIRTPAEMYDALMKIDSIQLPGGKLDVRDRQPLFPLVVRKLLDGQKVKGY